MNLAWTKAWQVKVQNTNNFRYVRNVNQTATHEDEWDQFRRCADSLTNCLKLGDNVTMNAKKGNEKGVDFYVVLCTHPMHVFEEDYTCHCGYQFQVDDVVVIGTYYQKWGTWDSSYVLLQRSHIVYSHVSHVRAIVFVMLPSNHRVQGNVHVYILLDYALAGITQALVILDSDSDQKCKLARTMFMVIFFYIC